MSTLAVEANDSQIHGTSFIPDPIGPVVICVTILQSADQLVLRKHGMQVNHRNNCSVARKVSSR